MSSSILVATLIADPAGERLSEATLDEAAQALRGIERRRWLDEGVAADLVSPESRAKRAALEAAFADAPFDVIVQPLAGREKRLLVADMDLTLIGQEMRRRARRLAGVGAHVAAVTERAMRGEIAFEPALRERVALLAACRKRSSTRFWRTDRAEPGARTLVQTMKARGARVVVVSGGFRPSPAPSPPAGADEDRANELEIAGGKLTGRAIEPVQGGDAKLAALREIAGGDGPRLPRRWRSATAPTISPCCARRPRRRLRASRRWPRRPMRARARRPDGAALCAGDPAERVCGSFRQLTS